MSFNVISFIKRATQGAVPVADDQPLPTKLYDGATGLAVSHGFTPALELKTAAGLLVKTGAGQLGDIQCTKSGSGNTLTVYDATSATGTPIATIEGATVGMRFCELYSFTVGCYIVQSGGTPGNFVASFQ